MSETLPLAERLKQRRQEDTEIIQNHLHKTLNDSHELWMNTINEKLNTIDNDITRRYQKMMGRSVWIPLTLSVALCATIILITHKTLSITTKDLLRAKQTLSELEAKGGRTVISNCNGKTCIEIPLESKAEYFLSKDQKRRYIIPKER